MKSEEKKIRNAGWISLSDNEKVKAWSHPSMYPYLSVYLTGAVVILVGLLLPFVLDVQNIGLLIGVSIACIVLGAILIIIEHIRYMSVFYVFTTNRVIQKHGIFDHHVQKVSYNNVEKMDKEYPLIGRILDFGSLSITTATPTQDDISMEYLPQLNEATEIIADYKSQMSQQYLEDEDSEKESTE